MHSTSNLYTLVDLKAGESAKVSALQGGKHLNARLSTLGFTPGVIINMTHNYGHGPIVVTVRDTRIAIGRGEARHILVTRDVE